MNARPQPPDGSISKVTVPVLAKRFATGEKLVMVTAYDLMSARVAAAAGVDMILVGDSLGMVIQGLDNTLPVTIDEVLYHTKCVARARVAPLLIADMPYGAFHLGPRATVKAALRLVKEGGAEAVKLEGGRKRLDAVRALLDAEIPVMGHLGLTPQSVHVMGGFKVQGRKPDAAAQLLEDASLLAEAGVFSIVLEGMPSDLAAEVTRQLPVPTIGIGAGAGCSGQVLVFHDLLGLLGNDQPTFVRRYLAGAELMTEAVRQFAEDVRGGRFPAETETYGARKVATGVAT